MKIKIEFDGQTYYRDCSWAYRWTGRIMDSPEWLTDMIADGDAMIVPGRLGKKDILFRTANGYPYADPGDIIIKDGSKIDVIRNVEP